MVVERELRNSKPNSGVPAPVEPQRSTIVMGIDSATVHVGWGVIVHNPKARRAQEQYEYVDCGLIEAPAKRPLAQRLGYIAVELRTVIERVRPDAAAVEMAFVGKDVVVRNQRTAIALGEGRGVVLSTLCLCGVKVIEDYSPATVKAAVTGNGQASKEEVARWVKQSLLNGELIGEVPNDASDALGLALAHAIIYNHPVVRAGGKLRRR